MNNIVLKLSDKELEFFKLILERALKDSHYFSRYDEQKHSKSLMEKLAHVIRKNKELEEILSEISSYEALDNLDDLDEEIII